MKLTIEIDTEKAKDIEEAQDILDTLGMDQVYDNEETGNSKEGQPTNELIPSEDIDIIDGEDTDED